MCLTIGHISIGSSFAFVLPIKNASDVQQRTAGTLQNKSKDQLQKTLNRDNCIHCENPKVSHSTIAYEEKV